jgi:hypothetical protein
MQTQPQDVANAFAPEGDLRKHGNKTIAAIKPPSGGFGG